MFSSNKSRFSIVKIAGVAVACALGGGAGPVMAEVLVSESNAVSVNAVSAVDLNLTMTVDTTAIIGGSVGTQASILKPASNGTFQIWNASGTYGTDPLTKAEVEALLKGTSSGSVVNGVYTSSSGTTFTFNATAAAPALSAAQITTAFALLSSLTFGDGSVKTSTIQDGAVTTAKLADGAVTYGKLDAGVQASLAKADNSYQKVTGVSIIGTDASVNGTTVTAPAIIVQSGSNATMITSSGVTTGQASISGNLSAGSITVKNTAGTSTFDVAGAIQTNQSNIASLQSSVSTHSTQINTANNRIDTVVSNATTLAGRVTTAETNIGLKANTADVYSKTVADSTFVENSQIVTTVAATATASDTNIASEKAVRAAITAATSGLATSGNVSTLSTDVTNLQTQVGTGTVDSRIATAKGDAITAAATDATNKANAAETAAKSYADGLIATEVIDRNAAIATAVSAEATLRANADTALGQRINALTTSVANNASAATTAIATAKSEAISAAASDATNKANAAETAAKSYADGLIATEVTNRNTAISTAVSAEATLRASADTALQGRADTLEQKTTGITYTPSGSNLGGIGDISGVSVRMTSATTYEWSADGTTWIPGSSSDFGQDAPLQGSSLDAIKVATRFVGTQAAKTTVTGDLVATGNVADSVGTLATVRTDLANEVTRAEAAEGVLRTDLANEVTRAEAAEKRIEDESKARDVTLQANIDAEAATRAAADTAINTRITTEVTRLDGRIDVETAERKAADVVLDNKINAETTRAKAEERRIDRSATTTRSVVGAVAVNIIAEELTPEELKAEGIRFNATVGENNGNAEIRIGATHTLEDGVTAGVGIGTESGKIGISVGKSVDVTENIKVGAGVSADSSGINVGPNAQLHHNGYGVGISSFGPSVVIAGANIPVTGPLAVPNAIVTGIVGAYKAITGKTKAEIAALKERAESAEKQQAQMAEQVKMLMDAVKALQDQAAIAEFKAHKAKQAK